MQGTNDDCTLVHAHRLLYLGTDFTYEAINLAYGDLLDHVPTNERRAHTPTPSQTMIEDEIGIDDLSKACMLAPRLLCEPCPLTSVISC